MRKNEFDIQLSRRAFLRGSSAATLGLVAAGLAGCSAPASSAATSSQAAASTSAPLNEEKVSAPAAPAYEVFNTDILVIGAGNNALSAATSALSAGKNVTVVDKGPFRHGGTSGMSWDAFSPYYSPEMYDSRLQTLKPLNVNIEAHKSALESDPNPNKFVYMVNHGQSLPDRNPDGTIKPYYMDNVCMGQFFRREMDDLHEKGNATVIDQTMITDLLINNGRCLGAIGLHIPTGTLRVFRSDATIICNGGCTWLYGWLTVSAATIGTPDNTADVDMAAFRHGIGIVDAEYAQYDVLGIYPEGLGYGFGASVCADAQEAHAMVDVNGDPVFEPDDPNVGDRIYFNQKLAKVIQMEGRGTPNGGVYVEIGDTEVRFANNRNLALLEKFGVYPRKEKIEISPEMYEHGGSPVTDAKMMTSIEGLFCGRSSTGATGGVDVCTNRITGAYAGTCAVEYANSAPDADELDWAPILEEYDRLYGLLSRTVKDGIRPHTIRHEIQSLCKDALGIYRTTEAMEKALSELQRIREEDMPRMVVTSSSPTWNREWKEAIENYNMLDLAEISVRASLMREETRGMYLRAEFPEQDDENWACALVCYKNGDSMTFEKETAWV